ncbi:MAG: large conductance mechanosensitive channel protein MscL [Alphaproteobacteria bacterium]|nr:large conductance mechanosensitive channel protein MscL [Alphaproteobacteria bacterium]
MLKEFKAFIMRGNVLDLAVGIIMGTAFTAVVNSLVNDIIMPPIGVLLGGVDFANLFVQIGGRETLYGVLAEAQKAGVATLNYGLFINALVKFVIVAFAVFLLVKAANRLIPKEAPKPVEPVTPEDILLLREIRDSLRR